jgi:S1-C subfamily serine protease
MRAVFSHITGIKAGQREIIDAELITVGRAPTNTLAFAPNDTRASARHAEIVYDGADYILRDIGSTNGTYINGVKVLTARLRTGDIIEFGTGGPQVMFEYEGDAATVTSTQVPTSLNRTEVGRSHKEFGRTTVRLMIDHAVRKSSTQFRVMVSTLVVLVAALSATVVLMFFRTPATTPPADFRAIARQNQGAVVFVYVRFTLTDERGQALEEDAATGSGFVASPEGHIVTNRHVLQLWEYDPEWVKHRYKGIIREIRVVFADQSPDESRPATVVRISDSTESDLAVLKVEPFDGMPHLSKFNRDTSSLSQGDPIAVIGYPLGKELFEITKARKAETTFSQGVISKVSAAKIQIDASANQGNSGGPILDAEGRVVAVLTQGLASMGAQNINFGTPIGQALDLLDQVRKG